MKKYDKGKLRYDLLPPEILKELVQVLTFGAEKYTEGGWKEVPDAKKRYTSALFRHIEAWREGETIDKESGIHHLSHAMCNLVFLRYFEKGKNDQTNI